MGTITIGTIVSRASITLYDETQVQWPETELVDYASAGINAIVAAKPDAYIVSEVFPLANDTKQEIPASGIQLIDVVRNVGGRQISQRDRTPFDHFGPNWHSDTGAEVKHFMHDKRDPRHFYVWPKVASGSVELVYAAHPPRIDAITDLLPIDDLYEGALHNYIVGYAYAKSTKRGDMNRANAYFTMFANSIGIKSQVQMAFAPLPPDDTPMREEGLPTGTR